MGRADGSVQARYSHITAATRQRLMDDLTGQWEAALRVRQAMSPGSPVRALDRLLRRSDGGPPALRDESSPDWPGEAVGAGLPVRKTGPELVFHWSGWPI
jgi:hypothetical protein